MIGAHPPGLDPFARWTLLVAVANQAIGLGVVFGLLAELQDAHGLPTWSLGSITGAAYIAALLGHLTLGRVADAGGARRLLVGGSLVGVAGLVWMAVGSTVWQLVAARALVGLGEGAFVPASRRLAITGRSGRSGAELGKLTSAAVIGWLVGPPLGAVLNETLGLAAAFWIPAALGAGLLPILLRIPPAAAGRSRPTRLRVLLGERRMRAAIAAGAGEFVGFGVLEAVAARHFTDLGANSLQIGLGFAILSLPLLALAPVGGRVADRGEPLRVARVALLGAGLAFVGLATLTNLVAVVGTLAAYAVAVAFLIPSAQLAVARASGQGSAASGQGLYEAVGLTLAGGAAIVAAPVLSLVGPSALFGAVALGLVGLAGLTSRLASEH